MQQPASTLWDETEPEKAQETCAVKRVSRVADGNATAFAGNLDADEGALECDGGAVPVEVGVLRGDALFHALEGRLRACKVDLFRALTGFGEDGDAAGKDFRKAANDGKGAGLLCAGAVVGQLTDPQFGQQRRVAGQDAEAAARAGKQHVRDALAEQ